MWFRFLRILCVLIAGFYADVGSVYGGGGPGPLPGCRSLLTHTYTSRLSSAYFSAQSSRSLLLDGGEEAVRRKAIESYRLGLSDRSKNLPGWKKVNLSGWEAYLEEFPVCAYQVQLYDDLKESWACLLDTGSSLLNTDFTFHPKSRTSEEPSDGFLNVWERERALKQHECDNCPQILKELKHSLYYGHTHLGVDQSDSNVLWALPWDQRYEYGPSNVPFPSFRYLLGKIYGGGCFGLSGSIEERANTLDQNPFLRHFSVQSETSLDARPEEYSLRSLCSYCPFRNPSSESYENHFRWLILCGSHEEKYPESSSGLFKDILDKDENLSPDLSGYYGKVSGVLGRSLRGWKDSNVWTDQDYDWAESFIQKIDTSLRELRQAKQSDQICLKYDHFHCNHEETDLMKKRSASKALLDTFKETYNHPDGGFRLDPNGKFHSKTGWCSVM